MANRSLRAERPPTLISLDSHATQGPTVAVPEGFRHPLAPVAATAPPALVPVIGVDDDLDAALERHLRPVALRAQAGDRAARDALYLAFEPKLLRSAWRIRTPWAPHGCHAIWERDDVTQEAFVVFAALVASWPPQLPFGRYLLANFPWRLRDAVMRGVARPVVPRRAFVARHDSEHWLADPAATREEERALVEAIAASLEPPLDEVLRLVVIEQLPQEEIAERLGVGRRTVSRHWRSIRNRLRPDLGDA